MRITPFVITFVTLMPAPGTARLAADPPVPFELFEDSGVIVPVSIDGGGPFRFLLDTGASHSAVSSALASRLELKAIAKTLVTTPAGQTWRPVVRVHGLVLGPATIPGILPSVVAGEFLRDGLRAHGVLGQDVLAALHYTLDYHRRVLSWGGPPPSDRPRATLPLEWVAGCPIVRIEAGGGRVPLRLIPDSGASHVVLFGPGRHARAIQERAGGPARLDTLDARRGARVVVIPELRLGSLVLRHQPAAVIDSATGEADGVLPLHLFRRVTFNGPDGYVVLEPW